MITPVHLGVYLNSGDFQVENCKRLGAKVVIYGGNFGEAKKRALLIGQKKGLLYVNGSVCPYV